MESESVSRQGLAERGVRAVFVSDVHLGSRHACASEFLSFLNLIHPEQLYIVGDFIDGWQLKRRWYWQTEYDEILNTLLTMSRQGVELFYTPGNHDEFLRSFPLNLDFVQIDDEFIHETADGRRMLVTHGDLFDKVEAEMPWLSVIGSVGYNMLLTVNSAWSTVCRSRPESRYELSARIKGSVKKIVRFISDFEKRVTDHARSRDCQGAICGHIHAPKILQYGDMQYCNTGDWVEHCTALIEFEDSTLELVRFDEIDFYEPPCAEPASVRKSPVAIGANAIAERLVSHGLPTDAAFHGVRLSTILQDHG